VSRKLLLITVIRYHTNSPTIYRKNLSLFSYFKMFFLQESNITFEGFFLCPLYLAALHESEREVVKFSNLPPKGNLRYSLCRTLCATYGNVGCDTENKRHYFLLKGNPGLSCNQYVATKREQIN